MSGSVAVFDFQGEFIRILRLLWEDHAHTLNSLRHEPFCKLQCQWVAGFVVVPSDPTDFSSTLDERLVELFGEALVAIRTCDVAESCDPERQCVDNRLA